MIKYILKIQQKKQGIADKTTVEIYSNSFSFNSLWGKGISDP
jgi:hypothetical protein